MNVKNLRLKFPSQLTSTIGNAEVVEFEGKTIKDLFDYLENTYEGFKARIMEANGQIRPFLQVFVGRKNIESLDNLDTRLVSNDVVTLLLSRAGG